MLYDLLAGLVAALGWPIGALIYTVSKEELEPFAPKLTFFTRFYVAFAFFIGFLMIWYFSEVAVVAGFLAALLLGALAVTKTRKIWKPMIIGFSFQFVTFVLGYFLS